MPDINSLPFKKLLQRKISMRFFYRKPYFLPTPPFISEASPSFIFHENPATAKAVAILVCNHIPYREIDPPIKCDTGVKAQVVNLQLATTSLIVYNIYNGPNA